MAGQDKPLLPEDSLEDPELAFDEELLAEPMAVDDEPSLAALDDNAPLDIALDADNSSDEAPKRPTQARDKATRASIRRQAAPDDEKQKARLKKLEAENSELKQALAESRRAEDRTSHAHEALNRRVEALQSQLEAADGIASEQLAKSERLAEENRKLQEAASAQSAQDEALSKEEVERLRGFESEAGRVSALEDRVSQLQEQLLGKEKEAADLQEKLDTEAARSYRLSQRRIPVLNREIEEAQEQVRELERKLQKSELTSKAHEEKVAELTLRLEELERRPGNEGADEQQAPRLQAQLTLLTSRLRDLEGERAALLATIGAIDEGRAAELKKLEERADSLEVEGDQRYAALLKQRTQLRVLRERIGGMLRLAEDLSQADPDQGRTLLEAIRRLADLPPDESGPELPPEA